MVWVKEEFSNKNEIRKSIEFVYEECFLETSTPNIDKIIDEIQINQKDNYLMDNPVLSYSWYLVFEQLFIIPNFLKYYTVLNPRLSLWIYHHGSYKLMSEIAMLESTNFNEKYYQSYLKDSKILDNEGELADLEVFIEEVMKTWLLVDEDFKRAFKNAILNPKWKEELRKLSKEEQLKWNMIYEPEDWIYHEVV